MSANLFPSLTAETAPIEARRVMEGTAKRLGYLPEPVARMANAPELLEAFLTISGTFEKTTLDPLAREVVVLTVATRNGCRVCVAMHSGIIASHGGAPDVVAALREQRPLPDARLEAVRTFTHEVMDHAGAVPQERIEAFLAHGFTVRNALEVVLGVGAYTVSTFANRMTDAPLDEQLAAFAWEEPAAV
ncbi:carboxymuconolactone decarboxylase family protein [Yinghuangia seranimata]|uniref:carboxymuconolactone decarboxylase family protein n=1 Tax=Yinghuangia seranimata TaxID=408067 RepID=UPI003CCF0348